MAAWIDLACRIRIDFPITIKQAGIQHFKFSTTLAIHADLASYITTYVFFFIWPAFQIKLQQWQNNSLPITLIQQTNSLKVTINLWWKFGTLFEVAMTPRSRRVEDREVWGGPSPPLIRLRGLGERHRPGQKWIWCVLSSTKRISWQAKTSKWSTAFWSNAWTATYLVVKSGQIRDSARNSGQFSVPNDLIFFRHCPEKFGMDGHLKLTVLTMLVWHH